MNKTTIILGLVLIGLIFSSSTEFIVDWTFWSYYRFNNPDPSTVYYFRVPMTEYGPMYIQIETFYYKGLHYPSDFKLDICGFTYYPSDQEVVNGHANCMVDLYPLITFDQDYQNPTLYSAYYFYNFEILKGVEYMVFCLTSRGQQTLKSVYISPKYS